MNQNINYLKQIAYHLRRDVLRATTAAGSGHATSCLSAADIVAALFFNTMHDNDHFILSKGHAAPLLYAAYKELGIITDEELLTLRQFNSPLEGHPTPRFPYVEVATGSLGQGLSAGAGIAWADRFKQNSKPVTLIEHNVRVEGQSFVYVLLGDSEMTEGSVWEALEIAAHYKLNNLIGIIDVNRLGQSTETIEGWDAEKYQNKCVAFGWHTQVINGHDMQEIIQALEAAKNSDKPSMIIAKTVKGYGLPDSVANHPGYHGRAFSPDELPTLLEKLSPFASLDTATTSPLETNGEKKIATAYAPQKRMLKTYITKLPIPTYALGAEIATRKAYGEALAAAGQVTQEIIVLDAEVKNSTYAEIFEAQFPERFIQCFIAEQNMIGMATGLASQDYIPFSSTFAAFLTRAYDQLRMAAISRLPLRIVGSHAGVSIGHDGPSQMGLEDIGLMRMLPDSIILYPCDAVSAYKCVELMANYFNGISYLRITRAATPVLYENTAEFIVGGCTVLRESDNDSACIIAAGITVHEALKAHEELKKQGVFVSVIDCYSVKPLNTQVLLKSALKAHRRVITVEDHYYAGGLGEAVSYELRNNNLDITCLAVAQLPRSGSPSELLAFEQINAQAIITAACPSTRDSLDQGDRKRGLEL